MIARTTRAVSPVEPIRPSRYESSATPLGVAEVAGGESAAETTAVEMPEGAGSRLRDAGPHPREVPRGLNVNRAEFIREESAEPRVAIARAVATPNPAPPSPMSTAPSPAPPDMTLDSDHATEPTGTEVVRVVENPPREPWAPSRPPTGELPLMEERAAVPGHPDRPDARAYPLPREPLRIEGQPAVLGRPCPPATKGRNPQSLLPIEVHVSIGHIEVRTAAPPVSSQVRAADRPRVSLDAYLRRRDLEHR